MHIADPRQVPTGLFLYVLRPARLAMLTDGATPDEQALAARHWMYSQELLTQGTLIFAGRTLQRDPTTFAFAVIRAASLDGARAVAERDPQREDPPRSIGRELGSNQGVESEMIKVLQVLRGKAPGVVSTTPRASVYDALMAEGEPHGIANAGYRAIESLRLEKGYRAWGADIGPDHSPLVAGLGWAVKLKSNRPFQGREALEAQAAKKLPRLLAGFSADPSVVLLGRETIYRNGERVGWLSSGGYGYTVGRSIGYGYVRDPENGVDRKGVLSGRYELEVATMRVPAQVFLDPLYDPAMSRIKS